MKKIFFFIWMFLMIAPIDVRADHIYSIDINGYIDKSGRIYITEAWDVKADSGTEWCKKIINLENSSVSDFNVTMDDATLNVKEWDDNESLSEKAGYYGINNVADGVELCFGKSDMERHKFMIVYSISDYIITTEDSQVLYHVLSPKVTVDNFYADISTYYELDDTIEVFGYGYNGNSYINNGRIIFSDIDGLTNQYVVALVKFPLGTFENNKTISKFDTFEDIYEDVLDGGYEGSSKYEGIFIFLDFVFILLSIFVLFLITELLMRFITGKSILNKITTFFSKISDVLKSKIRKDNR